jgi:hypothetical protein
MPKDLVKITQLPTAEVWRASYRSFNYTITLQRESMHLTVSGEFEGSHTWTSIGTDLVPFLQGLNKDYLIGKLVGYPETLDSVTTKANLLQVAEDNNLEGFAEALEEGAIYSMEDIESMVYSFKIDPMLLGDAVVKKHHASVDIFWDHIWSAWVKQL